MQSKKQTCMQAIKPKASTTPTPKVTMHGYAYV